MYLRVGLVEKLFHYAEHVSDKIEPPPYHEQEWTSGGGVVNTKQ